MLWRKRRAFLPPEVLIGVSAGYTTSFTAPNNLHIRSIKLYCGLRIWAITHISAAPPPSTQSRDVLLFLIPIFLDSQTAIIQPHGQQPAYQKRQYGSKRLYLVFCGAKGVVSIKIMRIMFSCKCTFVPRCQATPYKETSKLKSPMPLLHQGC